MKRKLQGRDKQRFDSADWEIEKTKKKEAGASNLGGAKKPIPDDVRQAEQAAQAQNEA